MERSQPKPVEFDSDNSNLIEIEHVQRWKKEFPEYFTKQEVKENEPPRDKVPKFCKGPQNWRDWFTKQEPFVRGMFNWKTNEYDIRYGRYRVPKFSDLNKILRPEWPDYVKEFAQPFTAAEKKFGSNYRRIWNWFNCKKQSLFSSNKDTVEQWILFSSRVKSKVEGHGSKWTI